MRILKQSTAANVMLFMTDSADHVTGKTGLTLTITASKDGAAFATISPTVTDRGNGWYSLALTTAHTDTLGDLALHVTGTGADPTDALCRVVAVDLADATAFGLSRLDAAVSSRSTYAGADTAGTTTLLTRVPSALTITGGAVTVGTNNDKTGYSLSALGLSAISSWTVGITGNITGNVSGSVGSVTAAVTLPGIPANWITAAGINAGALNGKGDWLLSSGYTTPPTTAQIADKVLGRSLAGGADGGRTVQDALRLLRNKRAVAGATLTVYAEDDTTSAWTANLTSDAAAQPITVIDPP